MDARVLEAAKTDIHIHSALASANLGGVSEKETLIGLVVVLAEAKKVLEESIVQYLRRSSPEQFDTTNATINNLMAESERCAKDCAQLRKEMDQTQNTELKLYIWTEFNPDAVSGLAFAIAETVEEAKELVKAAHQPCCVWDWGRLTIHDLGKCAYMVDGGS